MSLTRLSGKTVRFPLVWMAIAGIFVFYPLEAVALDRNAKTVLSYGGESGQEDLKGFFADLEVGLTRRGNLSMVIGGRIQESDREAPDTNRNSIRAGVGYYLFPSTRVVLEGRWVSSEFDQTAFGAEFQAETTTFEPRLTLRHRFLPSKERVSPFVLAGLGYAVNRVDLKGGPPGSEIDALISPKVEDGLTSRLGAGVDFSFSETVAVTLSTMYSIHEYEFTKTNRLTGETAETKVNIGGWSLLLGMRLFVIF
jgi:opacity protein-like surface antigen